MKLNYIPRSPLEKFGQKISNLLVENFPQTFYVGGMVRDLLLKRKVVDVDIATEALPEQIITLLKKNNVSYEDPHKKYGSVTAKQGSLYAEITTLRKDVYKNSRYPKISFVKQPETDSKRRDFTVNALYLSPKTGIIKDFKKGIADIRRKRLKFIGNPKTSIHQDPLRIVRALRFALLLNFSIETSAKKAIKQNFALLNNLTKSKTQKEILKLQNKTLRGKLKKITSGSKKSLTIF